MRRNFRSSDIRESAKIKLQINANSYIMTLLFNYDILTISLIIAKTALK